MSMTLGDARKRVRFHLKDRNPSSQVFSTFEVNDAIFAAMIEVAGESRLGKAWLSAAVALSNATDTYDLPGVNYAQLLSVRLNSTKHQLELRTREQLERLRDGDTSPSTAGAGIPVIYTAWEDADQVLKLQLWPWPSGADTLDILRSLLPVAFTSDADLIPFDGYGCEATALRASGNLVAIAAPDVLQRLGLGDTAAQSFLSRAGKHEKASRMRAATVGQHANARRGRNY